MIGRAWRRMNFALDGGQSPRVARAGRGRLRPSWLVCCGVVVMASSGCKKGLPQADENSAPAGIPNVERVPPELADRVLAKVGDRVITVADYATVLDRMDRFERMRYQTPERRKALLDELINTELLAREAERRGLDKLPETQAYVNQLLADEVRRRLRGTLPQPEQLAADEVQAYYAAHRDELRLPERRRVAVLTVASEAAGEKVLTELKADGSVARWNELSRTNHIVASPAGALPVVVLGDEGFVAATEDPAASEQITPAIKAAAFKIPEAGGVYPALVRENELFHVVRVTTIAAAHLLSLEEADAMVRARIIEQKLAAKESELHELLESEVPVEINEAVLSRLKRAAP